MFYTLMATGQRGGPIHRVPCRARCGRSWWWRGERVTRTATAGTRSARTPRPRMCTPRKVGVGDLVRVYMGVGVDGLVKGRYGRGEFGRSRHGWCWWHGREYFFAFFLIPN
jgi:hypothetical protein